MPALPSLPRPSSVMSLFSPKTPCGGGTARSGLCMLESSPLGQLTLLGGLITNERDIFLR